MLNLIIISNFQFEGYDPKFEQTSLPTGMNMFAIYPGELWATSEDRLVTFLHLILHFEFVYVNTFHFIL